MPTIKIVPMPGVAVPGLQGPRGYQGDPGIPGPAGADANLGYLTITSETDPQEGDLTTLEAPGNITIQSPTAPGLVTIQTYLGLNVNTHPTQGGIYINGRTPDNKVLTAGDLVSTTLFPEPVDWTPVLSNNGFSQTSNISHGHYYKYGRMTVVNLNVPFTNVTNFGTGQYSLTLPFAAATHMDIFGGTLHDTSTNSFYTIKGHVEANSNVMTLWYLSVVTKDAELDHNSPFELDTTDLFHMNFIYETVA